MANKTSRVRGLAHAQIKDMREEVLRKIRWWEPRTRRSAQRERQKEAEKSSTEWGTRAVKKISAGQTQIQRRGTSTGRDKDHTKNKQEK
jgi:hypothetical protein